MKVKRSNGSISFTAENKQDSLDLLKFLEAAAGRGNDPKRPSLFKEMQMAIKAGDIVRTIRSEPDASYLEFEVADIVDFHGERMAVSDHYGMINIDLLETKEWAKNGGQS